MLHLAPLTLLALATTAFSSPTPQTNSNDTPPSFDDKFGVAATGPGIPGNAQLTASRSRLFIGGTQTSFCDGGERQDYATFVLSSDGTVFLWKTDNPPQQLWVDASGMGQGITGYTTGAEPAPRNAGRDRFAVDEVTGSLTFNGVGAKGCPTGEEGSWSVWFTENEKPGFQEGCVGVELRAYEAPARIGCTYSQAEN